MRPSRPGPLRPGSPAIPAAPLARRTSRGLLLAGGVTLAALAGAAAHAPTPLAAQQAAILPAGIQLADGPDAAEFAARRAALGATLPGDGVFVAMGSPEPPRDYMPYEQDPAFRYLTGLIEPSLALVMVRSGDTVDELLFLRTRDPSRELWEGSRLGLDGGTALTGIPSRSMLDLPAVVDSLLSIHPRLFTLGAVSPASEARVEENQTYAQQLLGRILDRRSGVEVRAVDPQLSRIRALKSQAELDLIRRAVYISADAHREVMKGVAPGMNEFEIRGLVEYTFFRNGGEGPAYSPIVGSGANATTLHYRSADRFMHDGELLLFDVAAQYRGYAADVTRTVPVNGRFTPEQRAIYQLVLDAQKAAEALFAPGATWPEMNQAANRVLAEGLTALGLIEAPDAMYDCGEGRRCPQLRLWYMHGLGHGVGMAVHDPDLAAFGGFQAGTAISIEPGIYIREDALDFLPDTPDNRALIARIRPAHERYRNIGVRIEDIFILDERGVERVSAAAPREVDEVEALMATGGAPADRRPDFVEWYRETGLTPPGGR
jgi:Xaa-Pro aminopeptidase